MHRAVQSRSALAAAVVAAVLVLACAACGATLARAPTATPLPTSTPSLLSPTPASEPWLHLRADEWRLSVLDGSPPLEDVVVTLRLESDPTVAGYTGCSTYSGYYETNGDDVRISRLNRYFLGCKVPGALDQERAYLQALAAVAGRRITPTRIEFLDAAGKTILAFVAWQRPAPDPALAGRLWLLKQLRGQPLVEGSVISLRLGHEVRLANTENALVGFGGCTRYVLGEFDVADEGILRVSRIGSGWGTPDEAECLGSPGAAEQQGAYIDALRSAAAYSLDDGRLEVRDRADETILVYEEQPEFSGGELAGTAWRLVSQGGLPPGGLPPGGGAPLIVAFHDQHQGSGHAGCVDFSFSYAAHDGKVDNMNTAPLGFDCAPGMGPQPNWQPLMDAEHYRRVEGRLEISTLWGVTLVFEPMTDVASGDLSGSTWTLQAFLAPDPDSESQELRPVSPCLLDGSEISLSFEGGVAVGLASCNTYSAVYRRQGTSLSFDPIAVTGMACRREELMEQEGRYLEVLQAVTGGRVYGDMLWLETGDGRVLAFTMTDASTIAELHRDSILVHYDLEDESGPDDDAYPFARIPEFYLLADGRIFYLDEGDAPQVLRALLTAPEVRALVQEVMDRGLAREETHACVCQAFARGTTGCVACVPEPLPVLLVRMPDGTPQEPRFSGKETQVPPSVHDLLVSYRHPEARPYVPEKAVIFVRSMAAADPDVPAWPLDPAWLIPPEPGARGWAWLLAGGDLEAMLAVVARNMGTFVFGHAGSSYEVTLVPWLPGIDYTDEVAGYRSP